MSKGLKVPRALLQQSRRPDLKSGKPGILLENTDKAGYI
jgi:hypothetical protein